MELESLSTEDDDNSIFIEEVTGLSFRNVSFAYVENGESVFNHWNAEFRAGTSTAVLGETGAGKTTLIRLILALVSPTEGTIVLTGPQGDWRYHPEPVLILFMYHREILFLAVQSGIIF